MTFSANPLANLANMLKDIDETTRLVSPKCPHCGRPDGGILRRDQTPYEAGLVDRKRCPEGDCPMRKGART